MAGGTWGLGACSWHGRSEARQLPGPTPAICWCTQRRRRGLCKGRNATHGSSKNYLPKVHELVINDFSKPRCQRSSECSPFTCCKERANMEHSSTSQAASEHHRNCLPPLPSQAGDWKPAYLIAPSTLSDAKHLPPGPQLMYKPVDKVCFLCRATAHG